MYRRHKHRPLTLFIELATIRRVPSRTLSTNESDCPCFFAGDSEIVLGTCPACVGRLRPHTYPEGCKKATTSIVEGTEKQHLLVLVEGASPDRVLHDLHREDGETHLVASSSQDPRPPGLELQPGAGLEPMPRERSSIEQSLPLAPMTIKDTSLAMRRLLFRLKKREELLKLHLKHYHMSPAQFRHRAASLRLPEEVHDQYKRSSTEL